MFRWLVLAALCLPRLMAQAACSTQLPPFPPNGVTFFSPEQEGFLGDAIAEEMQSQMRVYPDPTLVAPLDRIAARLTRQIPANPYRFRFTLIEIPQANAFVLAGGRVYVSRRLIASVANEDELAGVIAHEMGHVVARQASVVMTKMFKNVLNVTSVGSRQDVFDKFHQLLDNAGRKPGTIRRDPEDDQQVADRVSLEVAWRAGYDPQGLARFFDRLTDNKGATGGFFSDLFGMTRPESKRLRELIKGIDALPASCRETRPESEAAEFRTWQATVAALDREDVTLTPSTLKPKIRLTAKLRPEITNIRFSPDGAMLLAQDDSGITVMRREPLAFLFRIPAIDARQAIFSKDSDRILFETTGTRIEIWSIAQRVRQLLWEPPVHQNCGELVISPAGDVAACFVGMNEYRLIELAGKNELARHRFLLNFIAVLASMLDHRAARPVEGAFTPDGAAFLMGSAMTTSNSQYWAYDLKAHAEMKVGKPLASLIGAGFGFLTPDRIAVMSEFDIRQSGTFSWPEGKQLSKVTIPDSRFAPATKGDVLFLRPFRDYAVGAMDLETATIFQVSRNIAVDRYGELSASERRTGEIALYPGRQATPSVTLQLPEGDLNRLRTGAHSPNLDWLTVSVNSRSILWNLSTGQAALYQPFDGGSISKDGVWTTTFERYEKNPSGQGDKKVRIRSSIALATQSEIRSMPLPDAGKTTETAFADQYEITIDSNIPKKGHTTISVRDSAENKPLWTRTFEENLRWQAGNSLVLFFDAKGKEAERILKSSPELKAKFDAVPKKDDIGVIEVLALDSGRSQGRVLFDDGGGAVHPQRVRVAGETLFVEDNNHRTLAYSLKTAERSGQQFGRVLSVDAARGLAAVQNQPGQVVVYDSRMKPLANFAFPANVVYAGFDGEGKRLLALTGNSEVYIEPLP